MQRRKAIDDTDYETLINPILKLMTAKEPPKTIRGYQIALREKGIKASQKNIAEALNIASVRLLQEIKLGKK